MVYIALGIVALSVSWYIYSYGRPVRSRLSGPLVAKDSTKIIDGAGSSEDTSPQSTPKIRNMQTEQPIPSFTLDGAAEEPHKPTGRLRIDRSARSPNISSPRSAQNLALKPAQTTPTMMPPPPRPALSARRRPHAPLENSIIPSSSLMPPPPRPSKPTSNLLPSPSHAATLRQPASKSSNLAPTASTLPASSRPSKKVLLSPGHSPLDWAALVANPPSPNFLRGEHLPLSLIRVPPSLLAFYNGRKDRATGKMKDAWAVWAGRVYNLTPYLDFHPGGRGEILRAAGKGEEETMKFFNEVHPWVSWEAMLGACLVGIAVSEGDVEGIMDDMD